VSGEVSATMQPTNEAKQPKFMAAAMKNEAENARARKDKKAFYTLGVLVLLFLICWIPFYAYMLVRMIPLGQPVLQLRQCHPAIRIPGGVSKLNQFINQFEKENRIRNWGERERGRERKLEKGNGCQRLC